MRPSARSTLPILLLIAAGVFLPGIHWGLPSRVADRWLFGDRTPWTGKEIIALAGGWEDKPDVGADVALNPLAGRERALVLNDTDAKRAEIVRRYRLFSYQPDEMITLRALAGMNPRRLRFDPRLYQYGGLWIYPVGTMLGVAGKLHLIDLRSDVTWYLDHPEQFGRFYVVARLYAAMWGLAGVAVVYALVRRIVGESIFPAVAGAGFLLMPVVVNMAHEAKPHLPGAVLMLATVWAGSRYVETGRRKAWIAAGLLAGAAVGMVLSSAPVVAVLAVMVLLRPSPTRNKLAVLAAAGALAGGAYLLTNPYIPINLLLNRQVLRSNFGNSAAMYHAGLTLAGTANAARLIAVGTGPVLALAGLLGAVALAARAVRLRASSDPAEVRRRATGLLLATPALWVMVQCVLVATGKPAEFGRFAILPDVFLMIEAVVAVATFLPSRAADVVVWVLLVPTAFSGMLYVGGFCLDSVTPTSRDLNATVLDIQRKSGASRLLVYAEPAPYCQPPVDLWRWKILLAPRDPSAEVPPYDVSLRTRDVRSGGWDWVVGTPISWADKPIEISSPSIPGPMKQAQPSSPLGGRAVKW